MKPINKQKLIVIVIDGWGFNKDKKKKNLIEKYAKFYTNNIIWKYPTFLLTANGPSMGSKKGQLPTLENNYRTLGLGRTVDSPSRMLEKIIEKSQIGKILTPINDKDLSKVHIISQLSFRKCFSNLKTMELIIDELLPENIYIHAISDGINCHPNSFSATVFQSQTLFKMRRKGRIVSILGLYFIECADSNSNDLNFLFNVLTTKPKYNEKCTPVSCYNMNANICDPFIWPLLFDKDGVIEPGDTIIYINNFFSGIDKLFRIFQGRNPIYSIYEVPRFSGIDHLIKFQKKSSLSELLEENGLSQSYISDLNGSMHFFYFFHGCRSKLLNNEKRYLVEYSNKEIVKKIEKKYECIQKCIKQKDDFIFCRLNEIEEARHGNEFHNMIESIKSIDSLINNTSKHIVNTEYKLFILGSFGAIEDIDILIHHNIYKHTKNNVPFILCLENCTEKEKNDQFDLRSVTITILNFFKIIPSEDMSGCNLLTLLQHSCK